MQNAPRFLARAWRDFAALFFPRLCLACQQPLPSDDATLCLDCQATLPETDLHLSKINEFTARFDGRLAVEAAAALYFFTRKSRTQHLIHEIKYYDKREAALEFGRQLGSRLAQQIHFQSLSCIVPVPMHPTKQRKRGYNQADLFADGLAETMRLPVEKSALKKIRATDSQTRKSRLQRLENTADIFAVSDPSVFFGKNVLIVDDVMTTGATLESCAAAVLQAAPDAKISFATIAFAKK